MSAEKKHDYHLVDPSPWPIYVSFSCLVLALGSVYYLHSDVSWGMYLGFALLIYVTKFTLLSLFFQNNEKHHNYVGLSSWLDRRFRGILLLLYG